MENTIYRVNLTDNHKLEFYVCDTNDINPHRYVKEIGICVLGENSQLDASLDDMELESLINYLKDCQIHIKRFNENSKPTTQENGE